MTETGKLTDGNAPIPTTAPATVPLTGELIERAGWFIRLRWLAVIGVVAGTMAGLELGYDVPTWWLLALALMIASYNILLWSDWKKLVSSGSSSRRFFQVFCAAQIILDYLALTVTIHLTGGIESPATSFFFFHIVVAATLLPGRSAYFDALLASALVGAVTLAEGWGVLPHRTVVFSEGAGFYSNLSVAGAWYLFLVLTFLISSFIAGTIGNSLERKLQALFDLKGSLEEANALLKAADKEKTDFMNLVTHELRSPMVAIRGILQALMDQYAGKLNPQQLDLLRRTDRRAEQMIDMVNDLLRLADARSESPRERAPFDLTDVVENVIELFRPQSVQVGVEIEFTNKETPCVIHGDRGDIRYVATNLVSNGVKYTPPGGKVTIDLTRSEESIELSVTDTGIGIPEKDQARLFTEFFRASNAKKQHATGTGLGLAIIRRLIHANGGTIAVESTFGKGSTFTVTLPTGATAETE